MSAPRRRTDEILKGTTCSVPEAARILKTRKTAVVALIDEGKLSAFFSGTRRKVAVLSIKRLLGGDGAA